MCAASCDPKHVQVSSSSTEHCRARCLRLHALRISILCGHKLFYVYLELRIIEYTRDGLLPSTAVVVADGADGASLRSSTVTLHPRFASRAADTQPAGPPPTTTALFAEAKAGSVSVAAADLPFALLAFC